MKQKGLRLRKHKGKRMIKASVMGSVQTTKGTVKNESISTGKGKKVESKLCIQVKQRLIR